MTVAHQTWQRQHSGFGILVMGFAMEQIQAATSPQMTSQTTIPVAAQITIPDIVTFTLLQQNHILIHHQEHGRNYPGVSSIR